MNLHIIIGEDDYLIAEKAKKIIGDGIGLEVIDSMNSSNADLQLRDLREADASFSTPPFLDPKKVTWWKNVHFLPGGGGKKAIAEEVKSALEKFAAKLAANPLAENQHFILSGPRLLKTSIFAKTLAKVTKIDAIEPMKPWEAARNASVRIADVATEMGLAFAPGVAEKFVSIVGTDMRSLISELGKMRDYLGNDSKTINAADVDDVTSQGYGVEPEVWDVTDAIGKRNISSALTALRKFELESGFAVFMTGIIEKFFRQLLEIASGKTEGMNQYVLRKNREFLSNWTPTELRNARARFLLLREKVVSGTVNGDVLVVTTLVRVMRKTRASA